MGTTTKTKTESGVIYSITENISLSGTTYTVVITDPDGKTTYTGTIRPGVLGSGDVATSDGFAMTVSSLRAGGTFVVPAGLSGTINIPFSLPTGTGPTVYIGGSVVVSTGLSVGGKLNLQVDGGKATLDNGIVGTLLGGTTVNISNGGTFSNGDGGWNILSGMTISFGTGGGTFVVNSGSSVVDLSKVTITNYDPAFDVIEFEGTTASVTTYTITGIGTQRTITLFGAGNSVIGSYTVSLATGVTLPTGTYRTDSSTNNPLNISYNDNNTFVGLCFLEGMQISTPAGDRAVETIKAGEMVHVYDEGEMTTRYVRWAGMAVAHVDCDKPDDMAGYPVHIIKDAFDENVPSADLVVTPEHCLYFEGSFIPARMLVNGLSIYYDKTQTDYKYYHIETDDHSVVEANNTYTESYLDTGNRQAFSRQDGLCTIGGKAKAWNQDSAACLRVDREHVEPIYRQYEGRAVQAGIKDKRPASFRTSDPDVYLVDECGRHIRRARMKGSLWVFMIPALATRVRIVSRRMQPSRTMGSFVDDRRELGVLVGKATFFDSTSLHEVTRHLHDADLQGWNNLEPSAWRWTAGDALLPLERGNPEGMGILSIEIMPASAYLIEDYMCEETALRA